MTRRLHEFFFPFSRPRLDKGRDGVTLNAGAQQLIEMSRKTHFFFEFQANCLPCLPPTEVISHRGRRRIAVRHWALRSETPKKVASLFPQCLPVRAMMSAAANTLPNFPPWWVPSHWLETVFFFPKPDNCRWRVSPRLSAMLRESEKKKGCIVQISYRRRCPRDGDFGMDLINHTFVDYRGP